MGPAAREPRQGHRRDLAGRPREERNREAHRGPEGAFRLPPGYHHQGAPHPLRRGHRDCRNRRHDGQVYQAHADRRRQVHPADQQALRDRHGHHRALERRHDGPRMAVLGQPGLHETNRLGAVISEHRRYFRPRSPQPSLIALELGGRMTNQDLAADAALLLRVSLAVMFYAHAWLKIKVFTPAGTAKYFESLGVPGFLAYLTIAAEIGG